MVVDVVVVAPNAENNIFFVLSTEFAIVVDKSISVLFVKIFVVFCPINVSVLVGNVSVPVLIIVEIMGLVSVLLVRVSVVARPTKVSELIGKVNVPLLMIVAMTGLVRVLFVRVCVAINPTSVSVTSGKVNTRLDVWIPANVTVFPVVADPKLNNNCLVLSDEFAMAVDESINVLLVKLSVVALPTKVSLLVGNVNVPVLIIVPITGLVNVLLVKVSVVFLPTNVSVASGRVNTRFVD